MRKVAIGLCVLVVIYLVISAFTFKNEASGKLWATAKIDSGDILVTITAAGNVEPVTTVQVGSQVSGRVKDVLVQPDQVVKKGECLAVIDPELLEADRKDKEIFLQQSQSNLAQLGIERENLYNREQRTKLTLARDKIALERAQANLVLATRTLERYQELLKISAATVADVEIRQLEKENTERDVRLKSVDAEQLQLELKQIEIDRAAIAVREKQAQLAVTQSEQALAKAVTNLGYTSIVSPMDGVVFERAVDPGQTIAASFQTPNLFKIVSDLRTIRITAQIDEAEVGKITPGQKVTFEVDAFRGEKFSGVVKAVRLKSETRANLITYPVIMEAENPAAPNYPLGRLRPGMTAYLTFEVGKRAGVPRMPAAALRFAPPEGVNVPKLPPAPEPTEEEKVEKKKEERKGMPATVYTVDTTGNLKAARVFVGENDGDFYEIISGDIKSGDEVVTGKEALLPGAVKFGVKVK